MIRSLLFHLTCVSALPNFVFILTDDQDLVLESLNYMNRTTELVANEGITFNNFYVNSPICCPSRSTILTGKYAHNVEVYNNSVNGGCSSPRWQQQYENTFGSFLKRKNYRTFYAGKYLNQYGQRDTGGVQHVPRGYDWWLGLEGNSVYYNYTLSINGSGRFFATDYLTDKITQYALDFLKFPSHDNFFMMLAPPACHAPFTPAPRHRDLFPDLDTVRMAPFNATPVNKHWLVETPPTSLPTNVTVLNDIYRNRIRTLQAVDDLVESLVSRLQEIGVLDNTYIFFGSDNGYHIGQFALPWDKRQPYESDIRVPFLVRGPRVPKKATSDYPVAAVDILPTILDLSGMKAKDLDGKSFKNELFRNGGAPYNRNVLVEYWGEANPQSIDSACPFDPNLSQCLPEAWCKCQDSRNNTYSCVLALSDYSNFKFCLFETGFVEAYDLDRDPAELHNLQLTKLKRRGLLTLMDKLRGCEGPRCRIYAEIQI